MSQLLWCPFLEVRRCRSDTIAVSPTQQCRFIHRDAVPHSLPCSKLVRMPIFVYPARHPVKFGAAAACCSLRFCSSCSLSSANLFLDVAFLIAVMVCSQIFGPAFMARYFARMAMSPAGLPSQSNKYAPDPFSPSIPIAISKPSLSGIPAAPSLALYIELVI